VPNLVVTQPSSYNRTVCLFSSSPIDYIVDSLGYFPAGSGYVAITPVRLADTIPLNRPALYRSGRRSGLPVS
jgi:hypothetical protein